jgi:hypothetical protein
MSWLKRSSKNPKRPEEPKENGLNEVELVTVVPPDPELLLEPELELDPKKNLLRLEVVVGASVVVVVGVVKICGANLDVVGLNQNGLLLLFHKNPAHWDAPRQRTESKANIVLIFLEIHF